MCNVREIELDIAAEGHMELPKSIYSCSKLEVLKLHLDFDIKVPNGGMCFPMCEDRTCHAQISE